jgi:hypothetical protein
LEFGSVLVCMPVPFPHGPCKQFPGKFLKR